MLSHRPRALAEGSGWRRRTSAREARGPGSRARLVPRQTLASRSRAGTRGRGSQCAGRRRSVKIGCARGPPVEQPSTRMSAASRAPTRASERATTRDHRDTAPSTTRREQVALAPSLRRAAHSCPPKPGRRDVAPMCRPRGDEQLAMGVHTWPTARDRRRARSTGCRAESDRAFGRSVAPVRRTGTALVCVMREKSARIRPVVRATSCRTAPHRVAIRFARRRVLHEPAEGERSTTHRCGGEHRPRG